MNREQRGPKKGVGRKWAQRLKELGERQPPKTLLDKIKKKDQERAAKNPDSARDLEV